MNSTLKYIIAIVVVVLVLAGGYDLVKGNAVTGGAAGQGEPSGFDNVSLTGGLQVGVTSLPGAIPVGGVGSILANGGIVSGVAETVNTGSAATETIQLADLVAANLFQVTGSGTVATVVNFGSTSTIMALFPNIGSSDQIYIQNASTTNPILSIAGGGFTLINGTNATSGLATSSIPAGAIASLNLLRVSTNVIDAIIDYVAH